MTMQGLCDFQYYYLLRDKRVFNKKNKLKNMNKKMCEAELKKITLLMKIKYDVNMLQ